MANQCTGSKTIQMKLKFSLQTAHLIFSNETVLDFNFKI